MSTFVPRLYYFNIEGKAEAVRLACAYTGYPLDDYRFASRDEFVAMKESGKLAFGQVPVYEAQEGVMLAQSGAIMRYIGKKTGLYPTDDLQAALVDCIMDEENDLFTGLQVSMYKERYGFDFLNKSPDQVAEVRAFLNADTIPRHLRFLEKFLEASSTQWIAGTAEPSVADFILVPRLKWLTKGIIDGIDKDIIEKSAPRLAGLMKAFYELPQIATYYGPEATAAREAAMKSRSA